MESERERERERGLQNVTTYRVIKIIKLLKAEFRARKLQKRSFFTAGTKKSFFSCKDWNWSCKIFFFFGPWTPIFFPFGFSERRMFFKLGYFINLRPCWGLPDLFSKPLRNRTVRLLGFFGGTHLFKLLKLWGPCSKLNLFCPALCLIGLNIPISGNKLLYLWT